MCTRRVLWKDFMMLPILGQAVYRMCWPSLTKYDANRTAFVLKWYDRRRAYNIWFKRRKPVIESCLVQQLIVIGGRP